MDHHHTTVYEYSIVVYSRRRWRRRERWPDRWASRERCKVLRVVLLVQWSYKSTPGVRQWLGSCAQSYLQTCASCMWYVL